MVFGIALFRITNSVTGATKLTSNYVGIGAFIRTYHRQIEYSRYPQLNNI